MKESEVCFAGVYGVELGNRWRLCILWNRLGCNGSWFNTFYMTMALLRADLLTLDDGRMNRYQQLNQ